MRRLTPVVLRPWLLPVIVVALIVPVIVAFTLTGPQLGLAVGALTAAVVIVLAARATYDEPIEVAQATDGRFRVLVLGIEPVEAGTTVEALGELVGAADAGDGSGAGRAGPEPELRFLAPAIQSRLARWASDLEAARARARHAVAVSMATLTAAGLNVTGRIGDPDPVQAVEDELRTFAANEVVVIVADQLGPPTLTELRRRLDRPVRALGRHSAAPPP